MLNRNEDIGEEPLVPALGLGLQEGAETTTGEATTDMRTGVTTEGASVSGSGCQMASTIAGTITTPWLQLFFQL